MGHPARLEIVCRIKDFRLFSKTFLFGIDHTLKSLTYCMLTMRRYLSNTQRIKITKRFDFSSHFLVIPITRSHSSRKRNFLNFILGQKFSSQNDSYSSGFVSSGAIRLLGGRICARFIVYKWCETRRFARCLCLQDPPLFTHLANHGGHSHVGPAFFSGFGSFLFLYLQYLAS